MMRVAVGMGSSLGDRRRQLELAVAVLDATSHTRFVRASRWYRTPPMRGGSARGWFLNGVVAFDTELDPTGFLSECIALEQRLGRRRARHWGDRTLDLDVLLAGEHIIDTPQLQLPHPAIAQRAFVLVPLREALPDAVDPITGVRFADLPVPGGPTPAPVGVLARGRFPV